MLTTDKKGEHYCPVCGEYVKAVQYGQSSGVRFEGRVKVPLTPELHCPNCGLVLQAARSSSIVTK